MTPLTFNEAKTLKRGDILCQLDSHGSDGLHRRWKVAGQVRTWKRDPNRIYVPLKFGLYSHDAITESDFVDGVVPNLSLARNCDCGNF